MNDRRKTKAQLIDELAELRRRLVEMEATAKEPQGAQAALQAQWQRFFGLLDALPAIVYLQAPDYSIRFANRAFRDLYGEPGGRPCYAVLHGREEPCDECPTFRVFETGEPQVWEWADPDETCVYQVCEYPFTDSDGSHLVLDLCIDITALKLTEGALRAAEREKAAILDSMSELVAYQDEKMTVLWSNRAAAESVGLTPEELVGRHCFEIWHRRSAPCERCPVLKARETAQPQGAEITSPDGRVWLIRGYPVQSRDGEVVGVVEVTQDITDRRRMEQALRESEERFRRFFDHAPVYCYMISTDGIILDVNRAALQILGYQKGELVGNPVASIYAPESLPRMEELFREWKETGKLRDEEISIMTAGGDRRTVLLSADVVKGMDGQVSHSTSLQRDITERKQAEEALQRLMEFNESIIQSMGEGVIVLSDQGDIVFTNPSTDSLLGYEAEELVGEHWTLVVPPDQRSIVDAADERRVQGARDQYELDLVRKDGTEVTVLVSGSPRFADGVLTGSLAVFTDITERKRSERGLKEYSERLEEMVEERTGELREAQEELVLKDRLAVLGKLAGGVSHELRNPLATITNAIYFLQMTLPDADETTTEYLQLMSTQVQNAGKIVSDLLDFSRETPADREKTQLHQLISQLWQTCSPPAGVEVTTLLPPDLPPLFIDPQQMVQVLENLVTNAYQAMPEGGTLTIEARAEDKEVHLSITDTGVGIPEKNMGRLFEPLFSTKPRGIGLGLAVSKTLVDANGGRIEVESKEGKGSTFTVSLPVANDQN